MRPSLLLLLLSFLSPLRAAEPDFPLTEDSKPKPDVPKGDLIKGSYTVKEGSVFPGTERDYTIYLPPPLTGSGQAAFDKSKPAPFMVFQDGVIYQAPTVFDNLIAKHEIPPLVGIFVKPGVVPAANVNALPRFNRSYEYDSVTSLYANFLIEELLPEIEKKHGIKLSTDPNDAAISGNSSGGIAAFMVAWHRPDRFRRVFTGVGTYVGIHGADQLPVLIRKFEPKPIKILLQSGTNDNNLYCGDWWMANQMMERSLTWAGYDVNHAWGEGGHNAKHASQIFPDVLRWLWKGWPEAKEVKANAKGESKWVGYEVCSDEKTWEEIRIERQERINRRIVSNLRGDVVWVESHVSGHEITLIKLPLGGTQHTLGSQLSVLSVDDLAYGKDDALYVLVTEKTPKDKIFKIDSRGERIALSSDAKDDSFVDHFSSVLNLARTGGIAKALPPPGIWNIWRGGPFALSPDQTTLYWGGAQRKIDALQIQPDGSFSNEQEFCELQPDSNGDALANGLCVDTEGRLYAATSLGIQVFDQCGRVNFIIPTPQQPYDVCFGGKDLSELFISCGDTIYKRQTKVHGIVSGQMAPIKPAAPHL
jgi:enterochelin esterase-like enzyme